MREIRSGCGCATLKHNYNKWSNSNFVKIYDDGREEAIL